MAKARLELLILTPSLYVVAQSELPRVLWGSGKKVAFPLLEENLALQKDNVCTIGKQKKAKHP